MKRLYQTLHIFEKAALLIAIGLMVSSCEPAPKQSSKNDTVTVLYPGGDERIFSPAWDIPQKWMLFEPLARYERYFCSSDITSGLVDTLHGSDDQREWTIKLRENIKWHDGMPVTAHDIKFTVELWRNPEVRYYPASSYGDMTVIDDYTLKVIYDKPSRYLGSGWDVYYPAHILQGLPKKDFKSWAFWKAPMGNGPYRFKRSVNKTFIELEANPDYYQGEPSIKHFIFKFGAGGAGGSGGGAALSELKSGAVDILIEMTPMEAWDVMSDDRFEQHFALSPRRGQIHWNHRNPLFADKHIRRALTYAIDRKTLHKVMQLPANVPLSDSPYTTCQFVNNRLPPALDFDPGRAKSMLADAGWVLNEGETLLSKDGKSFKFTMLVQDQMGRQAAVFIQSQYAAIGVQMDILPLDYSSLKERHASRNYDATIHWMGVTPGFDHVKLFGRDSFLGFDNAKIQAFYESMKSTAGKDEWDRAYETIAPLFLDEMPVTSLYPQVSVTIYDKRIKGIGDNIFGKSHKLWIEAK